MKITIKNNSPFYDNIDKGNIGVKDKSERRRILKEVKELVEREYPHLTLAQKDEMIEKIFINLTDRYSPANITEKLKKDYEKYFRAEIQKSPNLTFQ